MMLEKHLGYLLTEGTLADKSDLLLLGVSSG